MSIHQHKILEGDVFMWFGSNNTGGSGDDGATPLCDIREAGATITDAPILSPTPALISHVNFPPGCYEVKIPATAGNGFAAGKTYAAFCTLNVDSQNPTGFVGSFTLGSIIANVKEISDSAPAADNMKTVFDGVEGFAPAYAGPRGPGIYLDGAAGNENTVNGVDGTWANAVSTIAAATTLAESMGIERFYLINDTAITLAQTYEDYEFVGLGMNNQVNLGSQDVDSSVFFLVVLTGTQGGTGLMYAINCWLTGLVSAQLFAEGCWLTGNNTLRAATSQIFDFCKSAVAGDAAPEITFPGSGTTNLMFRHYSGGLQVNAATANDTMSYEADGSIIIDGTCTDLTISVRGNCSIIDNGTNTSLTQEAAINLTNINAEVVDALAVDTYAQPGQENPAATQTLAKMMAYLYKFMRNKIDDDGDTIQVYADDGSTVDQKSSISEAGGTFTRGEFEGGP